MKQSKVAIFGECTEGRQDEWILLKNLPEVADILGNPTESGLGVHMTIQTILFDHFAFFYKISEEGFSKTEYAKGLKFLEHIPCDYTLSAIALPGVGDNQILAEAKHLCDLHKCLLILTEKDLYDAITDRSD